MGVGLPHFHVWFATRGRRWLLQGEIAPAAASILHDVAKEKNIALLECEAIVDHVHLLLDCTDKAELSRAMHLLKGISSHRLFELYPSIKLDASTLHFWQKGYGSKIVPDALLPTTRKYIQSQWDRLESFDKPNSLKA
jgi:putative transposase